MNDSKANVEHLGFGSPAIYKIKVKGELPKDSTEKLYGMEISHFKCEKGHISILTGILPDQSALSGVLNILYDMHYPILSVKKMSKKKVK